MSDVVEFGRVDPDLAAIDDTSNRAASTALGRVKAQLAQRREETPETVTFVITRWTDWEATYRLPATGAEVEQIRKAADKGKKKDPTYFSRLLLARCCIGLSFAGEKLREDDGSPATWASPGVQDSLDADRSTDALTVAYRGGIPDGPGDGEVDQHALELIERAGFGDDSQRWVADPT